MSYKKNLKYILVLGSAYPVVSFAAFSLASATFKSVIEELVSYVDLINPILIILAFLVFGWGLSKVIMNSGNATEVKNGRNYMIWGIVAIFCLLAVYGIISFIQKEFGWSFNGPSLLLLPEA